MEKGEDCGAGQAGGRAARHLVVVAELLAMLDVAAGVDADVLGAILLDDPCVAVWVARVVDEARAAPHDRRVHHKLVVHAEQVVVSADCVVVLLAQVRLLQ